MRIAALLAVAAALPAQTRPTFELASVKPAPNCDARSNTGLAPGAAYSGFTGEKLNSRPLEVVGPMLHVLLEERFQLKVHIEPRETPLYVLTVTKSKLTPAREGG